MNKKKESNSEKIIVVIFAVVAVVLTVLIISGVSHVIAPVLLMLAAVASAYMFIVYNFRIRKINKDIARLEDSFADLRNKMFTSSIDRINLLPENEREKQLMQLSKGGANVNVNRFGISNLNYSMRTLNDDMRHFIEYIDSQTYIDQLTRVGNKAAYRKVVREINESLKAGEAKFGVAFFDMNGLRDINIKYGFEEGDRLLFDTADILKHVYGSKNVYHVASDEFIVVMKNMNYYDMRMLTPKFEAEVERYNKDKDEPLLSVSRGCDACKNDGIDTYREVFTRASKACAADKAGYYDGSKERAKQGNYYFV